MTPHPNVETLSFPDWLTDIAIRVDELIQEPAARERFEAMVANWSKQPTNPKTGVMHVPPVGRAPRLEEAYTALAAIHFRLCEDTRFIDLWKLKKQAQWTDPRFKAGIPFAVLTRSRVPTITDEDRPKIESMLAKVERDLQTQEQPKRQAKRSASKALPKGSLPDDKGYVAFPADPSAYIPKSVILTKHAPDWLTERKLTALLEDFQTCRIRWTRPLTRAGKPRSNRRNVHLSDFLNFLNQHAGVGNSQDDDWEAPTPVQLADRAKAVRAARTETRL